MNQASIYEIVEPAVQLDVDPVQLIDALKLGSGSSRAMELLNTTITPETVGHLTDLVKIDMEVFRAAMSEARLEAEDVYTRGMSRSIISPRWSRDSTPDRGSVGDLLSSRRR